MGYFQLYEIITDQHLAYAFNRSVKLAKTGPRLLREAFKFEEDIDKDTGFNRASWALIGGSYLNRVGDCQPQPAANVESAANGETAGADDGGWSVTKEGEFVDSCN